jgi:AraC-like DNA-binding protein
MNEIKDLVKVNDYCAAFNLSALHPLVSVLDLSEGTLSGNKMVASVRYHFYGVFLKQGESCILKYGRQNYDYQDGTLVFVAPGQIVDVSNIGPDFKPSGHALLFHSDLLLGTSLGKNMHGHSFFSYDVNEALHVSDRERQIVLDCFDKIRSELSQGIDKHSKELIVSNIELFLKYCTRFYERQFITRDVVNHGVVKHFESSLHAYFKTGKAKEIGTPSVSYFAEEQNLSPNYFGDLIKNETGKSAHAHIQDKLIQEAKEKIFDPEISIGEIAYELGFKYPQHFTRLFKQRVGYSPNEYKKLN